MPNPRPTTPALTHTAVDNPIASPDGDASKTSFLTAIALLRTPVVLHRNDILRNGLPWERQGETGTFLKTVGTVLFSPNQAFSRMNCEGGIGRPIQFSILGVLMGCVAISLYSLLYSLLITLNQFVEIGGLEGRASISQHGMMALLIVHLKLLFANVIGGLVLSTIGIALYSAVLHGCLMLLGGANKKFEATFRTVAYINGSLGALLVVPIVGWIAQLAAPIYFVLGLANSHETAMGRVVLAFVLSSLLFLVLLPMGFLVFLLLTQVGTASALR